MGGLQLDYPNGVDIKTFPAGKTIALARSISVWILIVFFLIIAACGFILMGRHFKQNYPFLISVDPFTEEWSVITYPGKTQKETIHQYQVIQEKLVSDFVKNWFTISKDSNINEKRWRDCGVEDCEKNNQFDPDNTECAISCKSDATVYEVFVKDVLPDYRNYAANSGTWNVKVLNTPISVNQTSGTWQSVAAVTPAMSKPFNALIFITIEQDQNKYPATFGYYIKTFNSYRLPD